MNYLKEKTLNNKVSSSSVQPTDCSFMTENIEKNIKEIKREFEQNPRDEYTIIKCADRLNKLNCPELALDILKRTYNLKNHSLDFHRLCGDTLFNLNNLNSAIKEYEIFLSKNDKNPLVLNRMGNVYEMKYDDTFDKKYLQTAIQYFANAFNIENNRMYLKNLIICFGKIGDTKTHRELFKRLLSYNPTAEDLWDFSCSNFRFGDFEESLKYIDYRFLKETEPIYYPKISKPLWNFEDNISDKTLLVHCEQGFGDTFIFCRFLETVKDKAKKVIFVTQKNTHKLIKNSFPEVEIYPDDIDLTTLDFDYHIPLMSLMKLWDFENNTLNGYLKVEDKDVEEFKNKFLDSEKLNIGISYYGTEKKAFKYRNIDLKKFDRINALNNVQLYSFQYGDKLKDEFKTLENEMGIINLSEHFKDFYDTAVAVSAMDLIITTDNVLLNLAGALGKKTFALMNAYSEYRWYKLSGDDIGWYKTVNIANGDGNDTIIFTDNNKNTVYDYTDKTLYLNYDNDAGITYDMNGKDLVINRKYDVNGKEVSATTTLKGYFNAESKEDLSYNIYVNNTKFRPLDYFDNSIIDKSSGKKAQKINGNMFDNTIIGGSGNDTINGCGGSDTLDGGNGSDTYVVNYKSGSKHNLSDKIVISDTGTGPKDVDTLKLDVKKSDMALLFNVNKISDKSAYTDNDIIVGSGDSAIHYSYDKQLMVFADIEQLDEGVRNNSGKFTSAYGIIADGIEKITNSDNKTITLDNIKQIAQDVAGWLSTTEYDSSAACFDDADTSKLITMLAKLNSDNSMLKEYINAG